jgi:tRNA (guanine-N7-)-methyltransferase
MSKRNKLMKFAEVAGYTHVYENFDFGDDTLTCAGEAVRMAGRWANGHFGNDFSITLELACGKGEYTLGLARRYPERNIIGVDIKGARIWKGARQALQQGLNNAAFLRTRIEMLGKFFNPGEVDEIWIVFPDPFPRKSKANRRLTSPAFLGIYSGVLRTGGIIHLKTDDENLYEYTLEVLSAQSEYRLAEHERDIYARPSLPTPELEIKTFYEEQHLDAGKTIKYIRFERLGLE